MIMIPSDTTKTLCFTVSEQQSALQMESGNARVLSTPSLVAMLEKAAHELCLPYLEEGTATVGTNINIDHLAATPIGMKVTVKATVTAVEGRKILFQLEAQDEVEPVAKGTHTRFIIRKESFQAKCDQKLSQ